VVIFLLSAKIVLTGILIANEDPIVVKIEVPIRNLPDSLDGFRIIQLSDMHIGVSVGKSRVKRAVEIVNELCTKKEEEKCQLVAFTGDVIDGEPYRLRKAIEPLKGLVQVPKLFVTGNHEHIHRNVEHAVELLSEMGIDSIINDNIRLPTDSKEQVVVVGLSDYSFRQPNAEQKAFEGTTKDDTILLAHQPNHLQIARRHDVNLMLSGHTHAGQFFPGTLGAWLFNAKYSGFYGGETNVYVSAGTC
jgi:predicted MPP superfamily phosphohydrolase